MKATQKLHDLGQSLWLDNITRDLLNSGTLKRYIDELSVTGLTSNPTIFDHAIKNSATYDDAIRQKVQAGRSGEDLFFDLALEDLTAGGRSVQADLRAHRRRRRLGLAGGLAAAGPRHRQHAGGGQGPACSAPAGPICSSRFPAPRKDCPPSRRRSSPASRSTSRCSSPASNTSRRPRPICAASNGASRPGSIPRSDRSPRSSSAAGTSRSQARCPPALVNSWASPSASAPTRPTTIFLARRAGCGPPTPAPAPSACSGPAPAPRIPKASDILYVKALAAPFTVNTMPEGTLKAFGDHGEVGRRHGAPMAATARQVLAEFAKAGIDVDALAGQLQDEGAKSFVKSWNELMSASRPKSAAAEEGGLSVKLSAPRGARHHSILWRTH